MTKTRIFFEQEIVLSGHYLLQDHHFRYLTSIMRKKANDTILIFNNQNGEWEAVISEISKKSLTIICLKQIRLKTIHDKQISLCFAPLKNDKNSLIIQKATELGVDYIMPIITERTIIKNLNLKKLNLIAIEASEQSERIDIPQITSVTNFYNIPVEKFDIIIFCDEREKENYILDAVQNIKKLYSILVIIGPEGGFTLEEKKWISSFKNVQKICLNLLILRSETAVIAALSIIRAALL